MQQYTIVEPSPKDAEALTKVALASKAMWGYDSTFMDSAQDELTVLPEDIASPTSKYYGAFSEQWLGFGCLHRAPSLNFFEPNIVLPNASSKICELLALFIAPQFMGHGIGKHLFRQIMDQSKQEGFENVIIHSDPNAEPFYVSQGCRCIGRVASGSIEGRTLPLMCFDLS